MRVIRSTIGATTISPMLLTSAERLQYKSYLRREETNAAISALAREGMSIKQIVRRIGHSRKLVRQVLRGERTDVFPSRQSTIDAYLPFLDAQWTSGCRKGAELWRRLKEQGFRGSLRVDSAPRSFAADSRLRPHPILAETLYWSFSSSLGSRRRSRARVTKVGRGWRNYPSKSVGQHPHYSFPAAYPAPINRSQLPNRNIGYQPIGSKGCASQVNAVPPWTQTFLARRRRTRPLRCRFLRARK